jgi:excisionase family DNA binding protein
VNEIVANRRCPARLGVVDEKLISAEEVSGLLGVSRRCVYDLLKRGDLAGYRFGARRLVVRQSVEDYKARSVIRPPAPKPVSSRPARRGGRPILSRVLGGRAILPSPD